MEKHNKVKPIENMPQVNHVR